MSSKKNAKSASNLNVPVNGFSSNSAEDALKGIEVEGIVIDKLPDNKYRIELENNKYKILAHASGKMKMNSITIAVGDRVKVELTPYDLTRGRIIFRVK